MGQSLSLSHRPDTKKGEKSLDLSLLSGGSSNYNFHTERAVEIQLSCSSARLCWRCPIELTKCIHKKNEITNNMHLILKNDCLITGWSPLMLRWPPSSGAKELKKFEFLIFLPSSSCLAFLSIYRSPGCSQFFFYNIFLLLNVCALLQSKCERRRGLKFPKGENIENKTKQWKNFFTLRRDVVVVVAKKLLWGGKQKSWTMKKKKFEVFFASTRTAEREMVFRCFGVDSHSVHTAAGEQHIKILFFLFLTLCFELCFYTKPSVVSASLLFRLIFAPSHRTSRDSSGGERCEEAKK